MMMDPALPEHSPYLVLVAGVAAEEKKGSRVNDAATWQRKN